MDKMNVITKLTILLILTSTISVFGKSQKGGVEFRQTEINLGKESLNLFNKRFVSNRFDSESGVLILKFSFPSKNGSERIMEIGLLDGAIVSQRIDSNGDGFFNISKGSVRGAKNGSYNEEYDRNFDKKYDLIIRHYDGGSDELLTRVGTSIDSNFDGSFDKESYKELLSRQPMLREGDGRACFDREVFSFGEELGSQIFTIAESYGLAYPSNSLTFTEAKVRVDVEKDCDKSTQDIFTNGASFDNIMQDALKEGLNCLRSPNLSNHFQYDGKPEKYDDPMDVSGVVYLNSVSMLLGQQIFENPLGRRGADTEGFPIRKSDRDFKNLTVMCSESSSSFKAASGRSGGWLESLRGNFSSGEALGLGSTGRSSASRKIQCSSGSVEVEHPYISLNMAKFKESMSDASNANKRSELKRLIFHEYLHTTGMEHQSHFDPVTSCSICCFPYGDRELVQRACDACRGESALGLNRDSLERQIDLQKPFLNIMGVSDVQYRDSLRSLGDRVSPGVIEALQQRVR